MNKLEYRQMVLDELDKSGLIYDQFLSIDLHKALTDLIYDGVITLKDGIYRKVEDE